MSDGDLIEVMGEATRDESTAIAQRLAAVAELQHISHARAVGQVQFACALRHRLPAVARVFACGVIDFRMVATILGRTSFGPARKNATREHQ